MILWVVYTKYNMVKILKVRPKTYLQLVFINLSLLFNLGTWYSFQLNNFSIKNSILNSFTI